MTFRTATEWVALLTEAQRRGRLDDELDRLGRVPLLICDEVGYIPFDPQAATSCSCSSRAATSARASSPSDGNGRSLPTNTTVASSSGFSSRVTQGESDC